MLDLVRRVLGLGVAGLEQQADAVEEEGDVVAHRRLNVLRLREARKGRTAYPAERSDLVP
jgi:hypothetical protein